MENLCQRDPRWANIKLGFGRLTLGQAGCYVTCHAIVKGTTPDKINQLLKDKGAFNVDLLKHPNDALALGCDSYAIEYGAPNFVCIAEVDFNPDPVKQQHFVVWLGNGFIIDPWDGQKKDVASYVKYISWRIYKPVTSVGQTTQTEEADNNMPSKNFVEELGKLIGENLGKKINDKEEKTVLKKVKEMKESRDNFEDKVKNQASMINAKTDKIVKQSAEIEELKKYQQTGTAAIGVLKALQIAFKALINFKF